MPSIKKTKNNKGDANTGVSPSITSSNDFVMSHAEMGKEFTEYAARLPLDDQITDDLLKTNYDVTQVDVDMLNKNQGMLAPEKWGGYYRGLLKGMDELVSTASVRDIAKGIFKTKKPTPKQLINISKFINTLSSLRLPTGSSGFNFKDGSKTMQHPTNGGAGVWGSSGKNHGGFDRARRQAVLKTFKQHIDKGSDLQTTLKAVVVRAITFTLNVFTAPVTAKNLKTLGSLSKEASMKYMEDREWKKERAKGFGVKQRPGTDNSIDRDWEGDDRSDISEDRYLGDELEKKIRVNKPNVATITNAKVKGKKTGKSPFNGAKKIAAVPPAVAKINKTPFNGAKKVLGKPSAVQKQQTQTLNTLRRSPRLAAKKKI